MLANLEQIRKESQVITTRTTGVRNGSEVTGHWRHYHDHSVWIEAHDRCAYNVVRTRRTVK